MDHATPIEQRRHVRRPALIDADRSSIQAGIDLVSSGAARRVILCGLRFAERLLPEAVDRGARARLVVRLDRSPGGASAIVITGPAQQIAG